MTSRLLTTLTLLFFSTIAFYACKKENPKPAQPTVPSYTTNMGGVRNWHRSHYYTASGPHFPTPINESYYLPDTSFAITVINDSTVNFLGSQYLRKKSDSVKQVHYFGTAWECMYYGIGSGVIYYYAKDSIVFCHGDRHSTSDSWELKDFCYTY